MKWINHQIVTGMAVYAVTGNLLFAACSMAGAVLPDKIEGNPREAASYWSWRSRHRGWSHWPMLYALLLGLQLEIMGGGQLSSLTDMLSIGTYLSIGALLHIAEDALCGKVPFITPWQKVGVKLFSVGSVTEYLFAIVLVLACYIIHIRFVIE